MIRLDPTTTAAIAIDMHRGHLDPSVATLPLPAERCDPVIKRAAALLAGINTTTCVLCAAFEATNLDFRVVIASEAVDSMDGEEMHRFALRLMAASTGWPLGNDDIFQALGR